MPKEMSIPELRKLTEEVTLALYRSANEEADFDLVTNGPKIQALRDRLIETASEMVPAEETASTTAARDFNKLIPALLDRRDDAPDIQMARLVCHLATYYVKASGGRDFDPIPITPTPLAG